MSEAPARNPCHAEGVTTYRLGGARPKAAVLDDDRALWLAKFPQVGETANVPVWEMTALDIAERAGLPVPERKLLSIGGRQVLLVRRFDRSEDGQRLHYISTRTLLGARNLREVADYGGRRGIAARLANESVQAKTDLRRLWRQAALNVLINNTDNHLRNHGLLRAEGGWLLAPVFDLDPNPDTGTFFNTTVGGGAYRSTALHGLVKLAAECELTVAQARTALGEVHEAVSGWDADASRYGATPGEIELMAGAFTGMDPEIDKLLGSPARPR